MNLDDETALGASGLDGRFASVLGVAVCGDVAVVLFDVNGDQVELDMSELRHVGGRWELTDSVSVDAQGVGRNSNLAVAWGNSGDATEVVVDYGEDAFACPTSPTGWWIFARPFDATAGEPRVRR